MTVELTKDELLIINNALNDVCNRSNEARCRRSATLGFQPRTIAFGKPAANTGRDVAVHPLFCRAKEI